METLRAAAREMAHRAARSVDAHICACSDVLAALDTSASLHVRAARKVYGRIDDALHDWENESSINAEQLRAASRVSAPVYAEQLTRARFPSRSLFVRVDLCDVAPCVGTLYYDALSADLSMIEVKLEREVVFLSITPRDVNNAFAAWVKDTDVVVRGASAPTIKIRTVKGTLTCQFSIPEGQRVSVDVAGVCVWTCDFEPRATTPLRKLTVPKLLQHHHSFSVSPDASWMVATGGLSSLPFQLVTFLTFSAPHDEYVVTSSFAKRGKGELHFNEPAGSCITLFDTVLICDTRNDVVQEITRAGVFVREITTSNPYEVALHNDTLIVGTKFSLNVYSYATGELRFAKFIEEVPRCMVFNADGSRLYLTLHKQILMVLDVTAMRWTGPSCSKHIVPHGHDVVVKTYPRLTRTETRLVCTWDRAVMYAFKHTCAVLLQGALCVI